MTETPQDFDLDAWLDDAERPERAVTVYQKAGLIAELDRLAELINNADTDEGAEQIFERRLGELTESQKLRAEYAVVAQRFHDSALTVRVQSLTKDEQQEIVEANTDLDKTALGRVILSRAIVSPKATPAQVKKLERTIGDAQFARILAAYYQACNEVPEVSADFLPKPSTRGDGGEY